MNCSFISQPFAIFNAAHTISENACITGHLSKCFMKICKFDYERGKVVC